MNPLTWFSGPYALLIKIGLVVAFLGSFYAYAQHRQFKADTANYAAEKLAAVTRAVEQAKTIAKEDAVIAEATAKTTEVIRWRTRDRIIQDKQYATAKPLSPSCVLDDDRLRNLNDALSGKAADSPGQPDYTLPPATKIGR